MNIVQELRSLVEQFQESKLIECIENKVTINCCGESIEFKIESEKEYEKLKKLLYILNVVIIKHPNVSIEISEIDIIIISSELWEGDYEVEILAESGEEEIRHIEDIIKAVTYIKSRDSQIKISIFTDFGLTLEHAKWRRTLDFSLEDTSRLLENIKKFFEYEFQDRNCCYSENYIEFPITFASVFTYYNSLEGCLSSSEKISENGITFEISIISEFFWNYLFKDQSSDGEGCYDETQITTLKVYNLNKFTGILHTDVRFSEIAFNAAKNILFNLSHKHSIELKLIDIPDFDDDSTYVDEWSEEINKIDDIEEHTLLKLQDSDLVNYYYRALQMDDSEFKYLAFYQIIECIFDEVYLHETVQDVKQIINSDWFSKHRDEDIKQVISVVEKYNKNKNDREKMKLVLERYFKGSVHDDAFIIANKSIIELLIKMNKIKADKDLRDLQSIGNIVYDFRCKCTHSNRSFPFRSTFENSDVELSNYILLIKKLCERIIMNYEGINI